MSPRGDEDEPAEAETIADRIRAVQKMLPPKPGVRSRTGYASLDYFAELLGAPDRQTIIRWTRTDSPAEPDLRYRERLAELSRGRYTAEDFARPQEEPALRAMIREEVIGVIHEIQFPYLGEIKREIVAAVNDRHEGEAGEGDPLEIRSLERRLAELEERVANLPTAADLQQGIQTLQTAIDGLAKRGTRAATPGKPSEASGS